MLMTTRIPFIEILHNEKGFTLVYPSRYHGEISSLYLAMKSAEIAFIATEGESAKVTRFEEKAGEIRKLEEVTREVSVSTEDAIEKIDAVIQTWMENH